MRRRILLWVALAWDNLECSVELMRRVSVIEPGNININPEKALLPSQGQVLSCCTSLIELAPPITECVCADYSWIPDRNTRNYHAQTKTHLCDATVQKNLGGYLRFTHRTVWEFLFQDRKKISGPARELNKHVSSCMIDRSQADGFMALCYCKLPPAHALCICYSAIDIYVALI